jgi:hypothetical protein
MLSKPVCAGLPVKRKGFAHRFQPMYATSANIDWIRKKASTILEESLEVWDRETLGSGEAL